MRMVRCIGIALLSGLLVWCSRVDNQAGGGFVGDADDVPDQESHPFDLTLTSGGVLNATIHSGHMAYYASRAEYNLRDSVSADFYNTEGNHTSRLTSLRATINEKDNLMFARDNVVVVSDSGITLITEELFWDSDREKIYTEDSVTIITETDTIFGRGFVSDRSLKNYEIDNVTGVTHRKIGR